MKLLRPLFLCILCCAITIFTIFTVFAHPGSTDSNGGHTDHSTGEYHYHHGYPEHSHYDMDGNGSIDCPYEFDDQTRRDYTPTSKLTNSSGSDQTKSITFWINLWDIVISPLGITILIQLVCCIIAFILSRSNDDSSILFFFFGFPLSLVLWLLSSGIKKLFFYITKPFRK